MKHLPWIIMLLVVVIAVIIAAVLWYLSNLTMM